MPGRQLDVSERPIPQRDDAPSWNLGQPWADRCAILDSMTAATKIERSGPAIRAALAEASPSEYAQFAAELAAALARASAELDLAPADEVLDRWWGVAAIRANPLTEAEREQLARARAGGFTGLWERDEAGNWVQL
jgi:hypothetical protein